ncbi:TPA: hypothetical protein ACQJO1_004634 [Vibrio parahaemolyticus]
MSTFSRLKGRLDRIAFDRLSDGEAVIDGVTIAVMYDKASFQFGESRGTERVITISQVLADEKGLKPNSGSRVTWNGKTSALAHPPFYEDGQIKLVLR